MDRGTLPVVAIIGRPNVGKSTLFNRIAGRRRAIVHDRPGVTRDRVYQQAEWEGTPFLLADTGGFDIGSEAWDAGAVVAQARKAMEEASVVIFLVDADAGLTPQDREVAAMLRKGGRQILLAANKIDHPTRDALAADFETLGFHPVHRISAEHGIGVSELLDEVVRLLPKTAPSSEEPAPRIAIVGRPNVGKSTLANRLLGEERHITHDRPGTTRDAVDSRLRHDDRDYILIDTAGIRRRGKVQDPIEKYSVMRAQDVIERCDLCLLLLDAAELVTDQDARIAGMIQEAGRGCLILVNKWDTVTGGNRGESEKLIRRAMPFMDWAPVLFVSARTGLGLHRLFPLVQDVYRQLTRQVPTPMLTDMLYRATNAYKPASFHGKLVTFGYMTQARVNPPTFVVLTNEPARVHFTYRRYLSNRVRQEFGFSGVPIVLRFRKRTRKER